MGKYIKDPTDPDYVGPEWFVIILKDESGKNLYQSNGDWYNGDGVAVAAAIELTEKYKTACRVEIWSNNHLCAVEEWKLDENGEPS